MGLRDASASKNISLSADAYWLNTEDKIFLGDQTNLQLQLQCPREERIQRGETVLVYFFSPPLCFFQRKPLLIIACLSPWQCPIVSKVMAAAILPVSSETMRRENIAKSIIFPSVNDIVTVETCMMIVSAFGK